MFSMQCHCILLCGAQYVLFSQFTAKSARGSCSRGLASLRSFLAILTKERNNITHRKLNAWDAYVLYKLNVNVATAHGKSLHAHMQASKSCQKHTMEKKSTRENKQNKTTANEETKKQTRTQTKTSTRTRRTAENRKNNNKQQQRRRRQQEIQQDSKKKQHNHNGCKLETA